jgi:hypothetical protein
MWSPEHRTRIAYLQLQLAGLAVPFFDLLINTIFRKSSDQVLLISP